MAVVYENAGDVIRLTQTRTGFRVTAYIIAVFWLVGVALMVFTAVHRTPTTLACVHSEARCTLTEGLHVSQLPLAAIVDAQLVTDRGPAPAPRPPQLQPRAHLRTEANTTPRYHAICGASGDPAANDDGQRLVDSLAAFRADPSHPAITASGVGRAVGG